MNWRSVWNDLQPLASLYTTHRSDACCMQMIWFCCLPLNMVYSRTWTCWSNTCQTWALTVNLEKTNIMIFQKRSRSQGTQHIFTLGTNQITHTSHYNYLGLKITSTGNFNHAVNELRDKARRAFYAIKRQCHIEIAIRIWLKIVESVIEPIALYGSEVWGPLTNPSQDLTKWEKHPIETLHAELCKNILHVHWHITNNACRAELGKYPLITKIQKRAIKFWKHLKLSDPQSYHYKALQYQEMSKESKPFLQLIQSFSPDASLTSTDALNHNIRTVMITYNIYIVIRETGQFSSKGIINDFIGNLNRLTVSRRFTEQAV